MSLTMPPSLTTPLGRLASVATVATAAAVFAVTALIAPPAAAEPAAQAPAATTAKKAVVNINQASTTELTRLPRVGPKLADRIVAQRTQHGSFKRIEDLMEVKGVGEKMFASLRPYLAVSGSTTLAAKVSSSGARGTRTKSGKTGSRAGKGNGGAASSPAR